MDENYKKGCFKLLFQRFGQETYWSSVLFEENEVSKAGGLRVATNEEVTQPHTPAEVTYSAVSFIASFAEAVKLREFLLKKTPEIPVEFLKIIQDSCLLDDWAWFKQEFLKVSEAQQIVEDANWVWDRSQYRYSLCIGVELLWLLNISRCLGIIEFEKLRQLRYLKIKVLGASVAAMTVDVLASLGCQNITCLDPGRIEPSNVPRLPSGDVTNSGKYKSDVLVSQLTRRNPYGSFTAVHGKLILNESERTTENDQVMAEFLDDADFIIEVIDDVRMKILVQKFVIQSKKPLLFIADVGNEPIVRMIHVWSDEERKTYTQFLKSVQPAKFAPLAIYTMVKNDLPTEHAAQFLLSCFGTVPFWSQTSVASRISAGKAAAEVLRSVNVKKKTLKPIKKNPEVLRFCHSNLGIL